MQLDPTKSYADIRPETGVVTRIITGVSEIPDWAARRRRIIEIPEDATVEIGYIHIGGQNFRPSALPDLVEKMWRKIQQKRDLVKMSGVKVVVNGVDKWFHSDDASRIQHLGLVMMGVGMPAGIQWKTMDGSFIEMTPAIASTIFSNVAALDMATFAAAEQHRAAMEASENPGNYDFSQGWPEVFQ